MTRLVNRHRVPGFDIYIGRGSKWGNPFIIGIDGTREETIEKYRQWIRTQPALIAALPELIGKTLGCSCKPKSCHGDVLIELLKELEKWLMKSSLCSFVESVTKCSSWPMSA
ncbi:MAG: DUF4326 domain-containing protein [Desulfobacterales bacterium]|nr:DUF4326 domain-containing protein [Desulfobacterales bacterium]